MQTDHQTENSNMSERSCQLRQCLQHAIIHYKSFITVITDTDLKVYWQTCQEADQSYEWRHKQHSMPTWTSSCSV